MLKSGERSAQQLSQELGVSVWSLKRWSKEGWIGEQTGPGALRLSEPTSALEIARPRRELEFITRQRDILKKALGILGNTRAPIADLKRLMDSDPKLGFAFRTVVEKVKNGELTAEDIIVKLSKRKSRA